MRLFTDIVYAPIRTVTAVVGALLDGALAQLDPWIGESVPGPERDAVIGALNGVVGDYLAETDDPLAISMELRHGGRTLPFDAAALREALPDANGKLLVLVHGSSMTEGQWLRDGHDHGAELARELGLTPIYVRYNSGRHISTNGSELADLLEALAGAWPVPIDKIDLLGHSMGGLVARSACHAADARGLAWRQRLKRLVCIGSPHHGAPLERGGSWIHALLHVTAYSEPIARLARIRSAGVTDLRFGNVVDEHWQGVDRFALGFDARRAVPLPAGVACYAIAGSRSKVNAEGTALAGDGLVPVASALGRHRRVELTLPFPEAHQWVALGTSHLDLLRRPEVYAKLRAWFTDQGAPRPST